MDDDCRCTSQTRRPHTNLTAGSQVVTQKRAMWELHKAGCELCRMWRANNQTEDMGRSTTREQQRTLPLYSQAHTAEIPRTTMTRTLNIQHHRHAQLVFACTMHLQTQADTVSHGCASLGGAARVVTWLVPAFCSGTATRGVDRVCSIRTRCRGHHSCYAASRPTPRLRLRRRRRFRSRLPPPRPRPPRAGDRACSRTPARCAVSAPAPRCCLRAL